MNRSKPPSSFICPLTFEIMKDPVVDPEGNSFERDAIERWLSTRQTSPITRTRLTADKLAANRALRDAIEEWKTLHDEAEQRGRDAATVQSNETALNEASVMVGSSLDGTHNRADSENNSHEDAGERDSPQQIQRSAASLAALEKEEAQLRLRLMVVEEKIGELLQHPLGRDGLGQKQVWRMKPTGAIWTDIMGDRSATEVFLSGAGAALEGAGYVLASAVDRVVGWTYKPILYSVYETARDVSVGTVSLTASTLRAAYRGTAAVAAVIETVDEHVAALDALQAELQALSDRLAAIECLRSCATLRLLSPAAGVAWFTGHSCSVQWKSTGTIRYLRVYLRGRFSLTWEEIGRDVTNCGAWTFTLPGTMPEGYYCLRLDGPAAAVTAVSGYFEVKRQVPQFMLWIANQRSQYPPGAVITLNWRLRHHTHGSNDDPPTKPVAGGGKPISAAAAAAAAAAKLTGKDVGAGAGGAAAGAWGGGEDTVKMYLAPQLRWWRSLAADLPTTASLRWTVPQDCAAGTYCLQAKVKSGAGAVKFVSPVVHVSVAEELRITSPLPGAASEWRVGGKYTVAWVTLGPPRRDISATLRTRFSTVKTLAAEASESASVEWEVDASVPPGWYYITVADGARRLTTHSDWIHILPAPADPPPAAAEQPAAGGVEGAGGGVHADVAGGQGGGGRDGGDVQGDVQEAVGVHGGAAGVDIVDDYIPPPNAQPPAPHADMAAAGGAAAAKGEAGTSVSAEGGGSAGGGWGMGSSLGSLDWVYRWVRPAAAGPAGLAEPVGESDGGVKPEDVSSAAAAAGGSVDAPADGANAPTINAPADAGTIAAGAGGAAGDDGRGDKEEGVRKALDEQLAAARQAAAARHAAAEAAAAQGSASVPDQRE